MLAGMLAAALILLPTLPLWAADVFLGPYEATVVRVIDSDTIEARIKLWPDLETVVAVRVRGVDTPEKFRPLCPEEKVSALAATAFVVDLLPVGAPVTVTDIGEGKYAGRVVGEIWVGERALSELLIDGGYARPYDGGTKSSWCPVQPAERS